MLKETETEETIAFFVTFLSLVVFQLGRGGRAPCPPPPRLRLCFMRKARLPTLPTGELSEYNHLRRK